MGEVSEWQGLGTLSMMDVWSGREKRAVDGGGRALGKTSRQSGT